MKRHSIASIVCGLLIALTSLAAQSSAATPHENVLYTFQDAIDGSLPLASLLLDSSGNIYGTTAVGGLAGAGNIFELTPTSSGWSESTLYAFQGTPDGSYATGSLVMDTAGNLYGTTAQGGTGSSCLSGCGTVFQLSPPANGVLGQSRSFTRSRAELTVLTLVTE
jgi:uncharacterized repeat protein (TIGR03803 family)